MVICVLELTDKKLQSMSILPSFRPSLVLTIVFSFIAPIVLVAGVLGILEIVSIVPRLDITTAAIANAIAQFLATFGSGSSWKGIFILSLTCSFVGALFDGYTFYRYQKLRD